MAGSGSAEKGKSRNAVCLKEAAAGILAVALFAGAGCAEINDSLVRYRFMDHTQKRRVLPTLWDSYEQKMREPRPAKPPARMTPDGHDQG